MTDLIKVSNDFPKLKRGLLPQVVYYTKTNTLDESIGLMYV